MQTSCLDQPSLPSRHMQGTPKWFLLKTQTIVSWLCYSEPAEASSLSVSPNFFFFFLNSQQIQRISIFFLRIFHLENKAAANSIGAFPEWYRGYNTTTECLQSVEIKSYQQFSNYYMHCLIINYYSYLGRKKFFDFTITRVVITEVLSPSREHQQQTWVNVTDAHCSLADLIFRSK